MSYGVNSIQIHKKLRLDKRAGSDNWYARLTLPNGKRLVKTTKTEDVESAKEVALRLYYEVDARIQNKLPATTRKFADFAKHAINRMETEIREGVGKQAYRDYVQALNKWLIPYFGGTDIAKLDLAAVTAFDAWRTAQNGRVPAQSTINNHNSALNRVLDEAELNGWIVKSLRPTLLNKGVKTQSRGSFSLLMCLHKKRMVRRVLGRPKRSQLIEKAREFWKILLGQLQLISCDLHACFLSHKVHENPNALLRINCIHCSNEISKGSS